MTLPWPYKPSDAEYFVHTMVPDGWATGTEATWALRLRELSDQLVGVVGIRMTTPDVGYRLVPEHRGNGDMTGAFKLVVTCAIEVKCGGGSLIKWSCLVGNTASSAVAFSAGFRYTGVGSTPVTMRDGSHPDSWRGEYKGSFDPDQWPSTTFPQSFGQCANLRVSSHPRPAHRMSTDREGHLTSAKCSTTGTGQRSGAAAVSTTYITETSGILLCEPPLRPTPQLAARPRALQPGGRPTSTADHIR